MEPWSNSGGIHWFERSSEVTSAASTRDLTVLATVKEELDITHNDDDILLARMITEQSEVAADECGRVFGQETVVDTFNVNYPIDRPLTLSRYPVTSISSIVEADITLTAAQYRLHKDLGKVRRLDDAGNPICWPMTKIVVTYVGGFELLTTLPRTIERAVILLVKRAYFARTRDPFIKAESVVGLGSSEYGTIPGGDDPEDLLSQHIDRRIS